MKFSLHGKNWNLLIGLITLLGILWLVMFAVPSLFMDLFHTILGNILLFGFILLSAFYSLPLAIGLSIVFIILYRLSHMRHLDNFII